MTAQPSKRKSALALAAFILVSLAAGGLGSLATAENVGGWYQTINRPSWNPPGWIFPPVWTTLYLMIASAAWQVWRTDAPAGKKKIALSLFAVQLALNALWSFVFFAWHLLGWACIEIGVLWLAILATCVAFFRISKPAGWLLIPYLAWVSFASFLTFTIWRLNA